ncbi:MAG: hypothetical protein ACI8RD_013358, partial [Bacillariaceae sp.]
MDHVKSKSEVWGKRKRNERERKREREKNHGDQQILKSFIFHRVV